jgi:tetratricopeptide (TPR) repeat protein
MSARKFAGWLLAPALLLGLASLWQLQHDIDAGKNSIQTDQDQLSLRSPRMLRAVSLEYAPLVAAIYWTRVVQYFGEKRHLHQTNFELLWPLLDITTTLDPHLMPAYRFGSTFLSDHPPRGAGRADLAVKLLERGIQANPDEWRLYQDLGNVYYFDAKDYAKASQAFAEGAKNPKSMIWMKVMAAKIASEGESPETSYFLWQQVYQSSKDPAVQKNAEEHLKLAKVELDLREINRLADIFEQQTKHRATRINELFAAGLLKGLPSDPEGYPYVLGGDGKAQLNPRSPLLEKELAEKK